MFGKKSSSSANEESIQTLGVWQQLMRRTVDFLNVNRVDLRTIPTIELTVPLDQASQETTESGAQKALGIFAQQFEAARAQETTHLNQYIFGLRALLWSSLNQVTQQLSHMYKENREFETMRDKMVKALDSDDLLQLKIAVKDWVVMQGQLSQQRKKQQGEIQTNFQNQITRLQNELYQTQTELKLDGLTQVYNRKAFDQEISKALQIAQLSGRAATLLLLDIDHFKHVNDTYGHPVGDKVLQSFAKLVVQNFPSRTDFVARYGGEEFVVLMSDCDREEAVAKAQRFIAVLRKTTMVFGSATLRITVSIGVASSRLTEKPEDWIKRVDLLLYQAKDEGRDCFMVDQTAA